MVTVVVSSIVLALCKAMGFILEKVDLLEIKKKLFAWSMYILQDTGNRSFFQILKRVCNSKKMKSIALKRDSLK